MPHKPQSTVSGALETKGRVARLPKLDRRGHKAHRQAEIKSEKPGTQNINALSYTTKRELAAQKIRNAIEVGYYQPGDVISQRKISEDLDLSVTPIREAIIQLSISGIIERHSHHSIKITDVDPTKLQDIYQVRFMLEEKALRLAIRYVNQEQIAELKSINSELRALIDTDQLDKINLLDRQFHSVVFSQCRNKAIVSTIDFVKSSFPLYAFWRDPGRLAVSVEEHAAFIRCIERNDIAGCIRAHLQHLASGLRAATPKSKRK